MLTFYPGIKFVHVAAIMASGTFFVLRAMALLGGMRWPRLAPVRYLSYTIDTVLMTAAHFGMPVSTTHTVSTAIMGVGFAKNPRRLKLGTIERIVWAWILTIPASGGVAWLLWRGMQALGWA